MTRLFTVPLAALCLASCGGSPSIDLGGSTPVNTVSVTRVDSVDDSGAVFSDCRVAFDLYGAAHVAYRYRGLTVEAELVDALRYSNGASGEWRVDEVGRFEGMRPGFDLALEERKPRILFAAAGAQLGNELVEATRDNGGVWRRNMLDSDVGAIEAVRFLSQPTVEELRAVVPSSGDELFRDGYVAFGEWRFDPVGAVDRSEAVVGFDAAMDRVGGIHACVMVSDGVRSRLLYAHEREGDWELSQAKEGPMAPACRIGASEPDAVAIAVLDESQPGQTLTVAIPDARSTREAIVAASPEIGDFDLVMARSGQVSLAWVDVPRAELMMAFQVEDFAEERIAVTDPTGSAVLALSPDGTLGFCTERSEGTIKELVVGLVARTDR